MTTLSQARAFVPFTPLKSHRLSTPRRKANPSIHSIPVPRANYPSLLLPCREVRQRSGAAGVKFEDWLEEHNRWKEMQRIGILQSHFPMEEERGRDNSGDGQSLSYVRLSLSPLQTPSLSTRKNSVPGPPQFPQSCHVRRLRCDFPTPRGRLIKRSPDESLYEDPQTHRLFACVKVPGLAKPPSAISSKRTTATRFFSGGSERRGRPATGGIARVKQQRLPLNQLLVGTTGENKSEGRLGVGVEREKERRESPGRRGREEKDSPSIWSSENTPLLESRYVRKSIDATDKTCEAEATQDSEAVVN